MTLLRNTLLVFLVGFGLSCARTGDSSQDFSDFKVKADHANIGLFWQNDKGETMQSFERLKDYVETQDKKLRFAMNAGMYQEDRKPLGLFIQNRKTITPLNTRDAQGNFYLKPNGVFFITSDKKAYVRKTEDFVDNGEIEFATQSGPMLVFDGKINPKFSENSENLNIRNGVCVLDGNEVVFSISKTEVSLYAFAKHFVEVGCKDALYLDGFVSRMYAPELNANDLGGEFGVMIGVTKDK